MVKIVYVRGWTLKPFKHGRPFVSLKEYEELKEKYEELLSDYKAQGENK